MLDKATSRGIRVQIRRILMTEWDPIGVDGIPEAADEYDSYIGGLYELLGQGASEISLHAHLLGIEVDSMELVDRQGQPLLPEAKRNAAVSALKELGRLFD